jgi:hypothetical protein
MIVSATTLTRWLGAKRQALLGDLIQALSTVLVVGLWCFVVAILVRLADQTVAEPGRSDFTIFYYTARMVLDGQSPYGDLPSTYGVRWEAAHLGNLNPPHVAWLLSPLGLLSYEYAARLWLLASYLSACTLVWATGLEIGVRWTLRRALVWGAPMIANVGFISVAVTGEWTWFLIWPFWLAWRAARRDHWTQAGFWLGVCAGAKLFFLLFMFLLCGLRHAKSAVMMAAVFATTVICPLLVLPTGWLLEWLRMLGVVAWWWLPMNLSWRGVVARTIMPSRDYPASLELPGLVGPLTVVGGVAVVIGLLAWLWTARRHSRVDADQLFSVGVLASLLLSPLGWVYYLPLALPPFLSLAWTRRFSSLSRTGVILLGLGLAGLFIPFEWVRFWGSQSWLHAATVGSVYAWSSLLLLAMLLRLAPAHAQAAT